MEREKQKIVEDNVGLVFHTIRKYFSTCVGDEDVFQVGCMGLMDAVDTFNPELGKFSTHASFKIRDKILIYLRKQNAKKRQIDKYAVSLDEIINGYSAEKELSRKDMCSTDEFMLEDYIIEKDEISNIISALDELGEQQRVCFLAYYIQEIKQTDIAKLVGISQVTVSRHIKRATAKLQNMLAS